MKIIIHSLHELRQLTQLIAGTSTTEVGGQTAVQMDHKVTGDPAEVAEAIRAQFGPSLTAVRGTITVSAEAAGAAGLADEPEGAVDEPTSLDLPTTDADAAPHNTDWHSDPAKINADGTWRARRKRDEAAYKDWLLALAVEVAEAAIAADNAEPVATETHALPQDEPAGSEHLPIADGMEPETSPTVDHSVLIQASQEAAKDAPDGTIDLLNAGKEFIKEYGTVKFEALKAAVSPLEDGKGKPIPSLTPGDRRLLRACMDNYALYL